MQEKISERFNELLRKGVELVQNLPKDPQGSEPWVRNEEIPKYQSWLSSVSNLIRMVTKNDSYFSEECTRLITHEHMSHGIPTQIIQKMQGLLSSAKEEWSKGLLRKIEYVSSAATFDDFLDHAAEYHKGSKKTEASVLASVVLEDTMKKVALKNGIKTDKVSLENLIEELVKKDIFTLVKSKRVKGYAAVRNHALHAEWDKFNIKDVGELINGTREIIEEYL
jgi:ribosomal protein L12E/L44/L45/RPP1/RPP2